MANKIQTIQTGQPELKNYYDPFNSIYEALKKRRKKKIADQLNEDSEFNKVPDPDL